MGGNSQAKKEAAELHNKQYEDSKKPWSWYTIKIKIVYFYFRILYLCRRDKIVKNHGLGTL